MEFEQRTREIDENRAGEGTVQRVDERAEEERGEEEREEREERRGKEKEVI